MSSSLIVKSVMEVAGALAVFKGVHVAMKSSHYEPMSEPVSVREWNVDRVAQRDELAKVMISS